nr:hypothetical protein CFP56_05670 [Quercus suber]
MRVSRGAMEGSTENGYRDRNWAVKVGWVKGSRAEEMHLPWVEGPRSGEIHLQWVEGPRIEEIHLGWVEGPQGGEMRAGWVQVSHDYLQPEGLLHADHPARISPRPVAELVLGRAIAGRPRPLAAIGLGLARAGRPRPLVVLLLGLAVASRPRPLATLVLGLAISRRARVGVVTGAALVLGAAVVAGSVSVRLFACPVAARSPLSPATVYRMRRIWLCSRLPTGTQFNNAK